MSETWTGYHFSASCDRNHEMKCFQISYLGKDFFFDELDNRTSDMPENKTKEVNHQ